MATKHNSKKRFLEPDTDNSAANRGFSLSSNDDWPKFITIESISSDIPITKLSPFAIQKGIAGIAGTVKEVKKLRSGQILVECCKKANAENLLHANMLAGVQIKTSPHPTLNYSKGIIRTRELDDVDEEEITNELKTQGVTNVKRIIIKREERMIKTNTYIITFNKPLLPERIQIGYLSVPVDLYIPNPLRCFNCQKYGHGFNSCKNKHICWTVEKKAMTRVVVRNQLNVVTAQVIIQLHQNNVPCGSKKRKYKKSDVQKGSVTLKERNK